MGYSKHELKTVCRITPLPTHSGHLFTTATFSCLQGSRCGDSGHGNVLPSLLRCQHENKNLDI